MGGVYVPRSPATGCYLPDYEEGFELPILANDLGGANDAETYGGSPSAAFVDG